MPGRTDATTLDLFEKPFLKAQGETPKLHAELADVLRRLAESTRAPVSG
jgi:hypothetical protein